MVKSASFVKIEGQVRIVAVLHNNLLAGAVVPTKPAENRLEPLPASEARLLYRKIDRGSNLVITTFSSGDILVTGEDKLLKSYEYPAEQIDQIDWKRGPAAPHEENNSHAVGTSCWHESENAKQIVTGGRDGTILIRKISNLSSALEPIKAHAVHTGGVTAICYSSTRNTVYSAGGDGSFMAHTVGGHQNPAEPIKADVGLNEALGDMPEVERVPVNQIRIYKDILLEEFNKQ
jgi:WD40 repeat protein